MRKLNNRRLYESIMRDVSKTIKKHLNEGFNYWNTSTRTWDVVHDPKVERFFDKSLEFYDNWISYIGNDTINKLIEDGQLVEGYTNWDEATDIIFDAYEEGLSKAVGGNWWTLGETLGYSDDDLDRLWNDVMQAKVDIVSDYDFPEEYYE